MQQATLKVVHESGLHARPADVFVRTAKLFQSMITVSNGAKKANAKSILEVILLGANQGSEITVQCEGPDEGEALAALQALVDSNFGNPDPRVM